MNPLKYLSGRFRFVSFIGDEPSSIDKQDGALYSEKGLYGKMLKKYLNWLGLSRSLVYLSSWKGPFIRSDVVFLLGNKAYHRFFITDESVVRTQGRVLQVNGVLYIPLLSPPYSRRIGKEREVFIFLSQVRIKLKQYLINKYKD